MTKYERFRYHLNFCAELYNLRRGLPKAPAFQTSQEEDLRLDHYLATFSTEVPPETVTIDQVPVFKKTFYSYDLLRSFKHSMLRPRFCYEFGDVRQVPAFPSFVKSRPIEIESAWSCLLPLETARHFRFIDDPIPFNKKSNTIFWRGAAYQLWRKRLLHAVQKYNFCDFGDTARPDNATEFAAPPVEPKQQLSNKFLFSIEGNDVASNLKWAMGTNSVVMMTKPKFETWFCESHLIPGFHYILIKDDFSDLADQYEYYVRHPLECQEIIENAHRYIAPYRDIKRQYELGGMIIDRYAEQTGQTDR